MNAGGPISQHATQAVPQDDMQTRLHGRVLLLARALWFITVAAVLVLYALSIPLQAQALQTACTGSCQFGQLAAPQMLELSQLGLSLNFYITYNIALNTIFFLVFVAVGALIYWHKSSDWFGIYVALTLLLFGISFSNPLLVVAQQYPTFRFPLLTLNVIGGTLLGLFFYLFPDGRFVPRWTRWLIPLVVAREFAYVFAPESPLLLLFPIELGTFVFAQIYRYRRASNAVERQQTKWFVYGASVGILGFAGLILFIALSSPTGQPTSLMEQLIGGAGVFIFLLLIPLSIMMAILRYRLWDVDILINRTLVYVPLTAILAGIFAASITLSQKLFIAITGSSSDAATVLTTLIVVAAFTPVKDGLQALVDKRFKEPPDPARKLKAFNQELQSVVRVFNAEQTARRFLDEAMAAFDAAGGAISLEAEGTSPRVYTLGDWNGQAKMSISLANNGERFGMVQLGARRNGSDYAVQDVKTLQENAQLVAAAIALAKRTNGTGRG